MTTELLARIYGVAGKVIRQNHANNVVRFDSGVHYFKLTAGELRAFKDQVEVFDLVDKRASHFTA